MKRAAIIGLGVISAIHIEAIRKNPNIELVGVCDIDEKKRRIIPASIPFFADYRELIRTVRPDVVHICLPHYLHVPVTMEAVQMGVHVLCEKPVAMNGEEGREFMEFEKKYAHMHIGICLQNRFNQSVITLKKMIESGKYGSVRAVKGIVQWHRSKEYFEASPWRGMWEKAGGGCMINQAVHTLDLLIYLGGNIRQVKGMTTQLLDYGVEVEDTAAAKLVYENQAEGLFFATIANYKNENVQIAVKLDEAEFVIEQDALYRFGTDGQKEKLIADARRDSAKFYYGSGHESLIAGFYEALEENSQNYIHVRDAIASIALIDAIRESGITGKPVLLSF